MNFTSKEYLPNSEERIEHLRKIIDGRPVAILAAGPSIKELEERIGELRYADICYFGFNNFSVQETHILQQIDKHLSVMINGCGVNIPEVINDILNFSNRNEDNMFVSTFYRDAFGQMSNDFDLNEFLSRYDKKLIFVSLSYDRTVPNKDQPLHFISGNTLQMVIQMAIIGKASRIVLFGADGGFYSNGPKTNKNFCYHQAEYYRPYYQKCELPTSENYLEDTTLCFNPIMPLAIRNVYKTYNLPPIDILNCSEHSFYNPFPNISYDDAFEYLATDKKYNSKSDLRIAKLSVISTVLNNKDFLKASIETVTAQSYPNLEHIIVYDDEDEEIRRLKQQYPQVKWIYDKERKPLEALKKGISVARGENIYYCPVGDIFANSDWLNISMDILENHPDISLVWGLSQTLSENGAPGRIINVKYFVDPPPQGKDFIYFWLNKKALFPKGSFCVRKSVLEDCFPFNDENIEDERKAWLSFNYQFNTSGYLPFFVPLIANYHRTYFDQGGHRPQGDPVKMHLPYYVPVTENEKVRKEQTDESWNTMLDAYHDDIRRYKKSLMKGEIVHRYRNGNGEAFPDRFSRIMLLIYDYRIPTKWVRDYKKILNYWGKYHWHIFRLGTNKIINRVIKRKYPL